MATNTRKLAALLGASGAGIADAGTINTAGITADAIDNTNAYYSERYGWTLRKN